MVKLRRTLILIIGLSLAATGHSWWEPKAQEANPGAQNTLDRLQDKVPAEVQAAQVKEELTNLTPQDKTLRDLYSKTPPPVVLATLDPADQKKISSWAKTELAPFFKAVHEQSGVDAALGALVTNRGPGTPILANLAARLASFAKHPDSNYDAIFQLEPVMNAETHSLGIHLRFVIDYRDKDVPEGKLAVMVCEVASVHNIEIKGTVIPVFEIKRMDAATLKYSDDIIGNTYRGASYGVMYSEALDKIAVRLEKPTPELRQLVAGAIAHHEVSHIYFFNNKGEEKAGRFFHPAKIREVNETRAYLAELAGADPKVVMFHLAEIVDLSLSKLPVNDRTLNPKINNIPIKVGAKPALVELEPHVPGLKLFHVGEGRSKVSLYDLNRNVLPELYKREPAVIKAAAAKALEDLDNKLGLGVRD